MSTSVASRYSHDSAPCETVDSRKCRAVRRLPTRRPSMSTRASTTVSMSWLPTARSSASRASGAELAPLDPTDDEATLCTSVIAHLQDQFAPHASLFEPFVRRRRALEHKRLTNIRLERAVLEHLRGKFQRMAVGLDQRF